MLRHPVLKVSVSMFKIRACGQTLVLLRRKLHKAEFAWQYWQCGLLPNHMSDFHIHVIDHHCKVVERLTNAINWCPSNHITAQSLPRQLICPRTMSFQTISRSSSIEANTKRRPSASKVACCSGLDLNYHSREPHLYFSAARIDLRSASLE